MGTRRPWVVCVGSEHERTFATRQTAMGYAMDRVLDLPPDRAVIVTRIRPASRVGGWSATLIRRRPFRVEVRFHDPSKDEQ